MCGSDVLPRSVAAAGKERLGVLINQQRCSKVLLGSVGQRRRSAVSNQQCCSEVCVRSVAQKCRSEVSIRSNAEAVLLGSVAQKRQPELLLGSVAQKCQFSSVAVQVQHAKHRYAKSSSIAGKSKSCSARSTGFQLQLINWGRRLGFIPGDDGRLHGAPIFK